MQFENHRRTALQYPLVHLTLCRCQQYGAFSVVSLQLSYPDVMTYESYTLLAVAD